MRKHLHLIAVLGIVVLTAALASCASLHTVPTLDTNPPPETTPYIPPELNVEFFDETPYEDQNMSLFQKYPAQTTADPSAEETPET